MAYQQARQVAVDYCANVIYGLYDSICILGRLDDSNKGNSICNGFLCFFFLLFFSRHLLCGTQYAINHNLWYFYLCFLLLLFFPPLRLILRDNQVLGKCRGIRVEGGREERV